jgi:hypothetical protein
MVPTGDAVRTLLVVVVPLLLLLLLALQWTRTLGSSCCCSGVRIRTAIWRSHGTTAVLVG